MLGLLSHSRGNSLEREHLVNGKAITVKQQSKKTHC